MSKKWNASIELPPGSDYQNMCIGQDFRNSNKTGNPMIELEVELMAPETVDVKGEQVTVTGIKNKLYLVTSVFKSTESGAKVLDEEGTANARDRAKTMFRAFGLDDTKINWDNPDTKGFDGKTVYCLMDCDEEIQRKNPTAEQLRLKKDGDIMVNPLTKKPLVKYWPKVREVFGLVPGKTANKPY